ncbi:MAG: hypothetical protein IKJ45_01430, partial [Kiritimatiellae bacterium]|nr:hypothetical protein [Kiritimatiellia bacterium]
MKRSSDFEPFMVITASVYDVKFYADGLTDKLGKDKAFYEGLGCQCVISFDFMSGRPHPLSEYSPDFVFYQDPRLFFEEDSVRETAKIALCCDIPYAIRTLGGGTDLQQDPDYHQLMFLQFPPTEAQSHFYRAALSEWRWAGTSRAIGHPILDQYLKPLKETELTGCVIYAPHFSFPLPGLKRPVTLSSFLENGRKILEYAQRHPEFPWLFKPHPRLYKELILTGVWTREEVENYYMAWGRIGRVCTDGDYIRLFQNA